MKSEKEGINRRRTKTILAIKEYSPLVSADEPYFRGRRNGTLSVTKRHFAGDETALCRHQNVLSSAALVGSPHHFLAQGMEVLRAGTLDDLDTIGSLAKRQTGGVRQGLGATGDSCGCGSRW